MPDPMEVVVRLDKVVKDFPAGWTGIKVRALDHVDLEVRRGRVFGLLGPNGSGKSTAMKLMLGLMRPNSGSVEVFGAPAGDPASRARMGFLPEAPYFPGFLTGCEWVSYMGSLSGMRGKGLASRVGEVLAMVDMEEAGRRPLGTYSKGMLQRIGLAQALVHDPDLLILDEPTAGLDPMGTQATGDLVRRLKDEGKTVIFCSHLLAHVESICDDIALLHRGHLLVAGALDELLTDETTRLLNVSGWRPELEPELAAWLSTHGATLKGEAGLRQRLDDFFLRRVRMAGEEAAR